MTDQNQNHDTFMEDGEITGERGTPLVATMGTNRIIGMSIFGLLCTIALGAVIYDGITKEKSEPVTTTEEISFKAPNTRGEPYIIEDPTPPSTQELASPSEPKIDPLILQREIAMREEALRMAKEKQKEIEKRLKSTLVVYDSSNNAQNSYRENMTAPNSGASLLSGGDQTPSSNEAFAKAQNSQGYETASAHQLNNLSTLIAQGKMIGGILETAIQSDLPGMVRAIVSEDVYSFNGENLLVPKGTRLVGAYRSAIRQGQSRVFIIWNRLIRPDGASIMIGGTGTDTLGRSGLEGDTDTHFMERFGSSILLSLLDGTISAAIESIDDDGASEVSLNGGSDFSKSAQIALENSINISPTVHIDQGARIKIFVGRDLDFNTVGAANLN